MDPPSTFPQLEVFDAASVPTFIQPAKRIHDGADVNHFLRSQAYRDIGIFILQLNRALCPRKPPATGAGGEAINIASESFSLDSKRNDLEAVKKLRALLKKTGAIIDEAPPDPGPRRFGNVSFRRWHEMLESRADELLREHLPSELLGLRDAGAGQEEATAFDELKAYYLGGFGSAQRLDYGTGHELSFVAFLGSLWKLGLFKGDSQDGEVERSISLGVIEP
jgi:serine/threonine-protein phosphatase 2A activator